MITHCFSFLQKSAWEQVKSSLWNGMEKVGGGFAMSISETANHMAKMKQRQRDNVIDHVY